MKSGAIHIYTFGSNSFFLTVNISVHIMWTLPLAERAAVEGGTTSRMSKYVNSSGDNSHHTRQTYNLRLVRARAL